MPIINKRLNNVIDIEENVIDESIWNDFGIFFLENRFYSQAEIVYGKMIDTIIKIELIKRKRLHKGLAYHNLGISLLYQNKN